MLWIYGTITIPKSGTTYDAVRDPEDGTVYLLHDGVPSQYPIPATQAPAFVPDRQDTAARLAGRNHGVRGEVHD